MSLNQSGLEKNDSQNRKPGGGGRSGNTTGAQNRHFTGGRGRGGAGPTPSAPTNRSYKKVNNDQVGQSRANPGIVNAADSRAASGGRAVENGGHVQPALQAVSRTPAPASVAKPADALPQKTSRPLPRAPSSQSASTNANFAALSTPAKGDVAKGFSLQFGSICPGLMNGVQVPARTSSAPPNLDEQKRDQVLRDASRAVPAAPLPFGYRQDSSTKADVLTVKPVPRETSTEPQAKRDDLMGVKCPPKQAPKPSVPPKTGISPPSPFHQPTASIQYGGPNSRIQSQGTPSTSLQMQMQQQVFVPGLQHPLMQTQGVMHQGQNLGYNTQPATQLPHQLGNIGINMVAQYNQQSPGNFGNTRKTVKITHPDTHEELRLDGKGGGPASSLSHHSAPAQNQPLPVYTTNHPMGYYANNYATGPPYFPSPSSVPLTSTQLNATGQGSRFNYPVSHVQSNMSFVNQPSNIFPAKSLITTLGNVDPSNADHIRGVQNMIPPAQQNSTPVTIKAAGEKATRSTGIVKVEPKKIPNLKLDSAACKNDVDVSLQSKPGVERLNQSAPVPALFSVETSIPATPPAVLNTNTSDLASIPSCVDGSGKFTDVISTSTQDIEMHQSKKGNLQPSQQVDGQSDSKVVKDLDDSSETATVEVSEVKTVRSSSGLKDGVSEANRLSPIVTDTASSDSRAVKDSANTFHPSESCESQNVINKVAEQDELPLCKDLTRESSISKIIEEEHPEILLSENLLKCSDTLQGADQDHQVKLVENASRHSSLVVGTMEATQGEADSATSVTEGEIMQSKPSDDISTSNISSCLLDSPTFQDNDISKSSMSDNETLPVSAHISEANATHETEIVDNPRPSSSSGSVSGLSKVSLESIKTKNRGKKKLKEVLQKADALGTTTDLYMAYKGPDEKKESFVVSEHAAEGNMKEMSTDANTEISTQENKYEHSKLELDDWEDAADISTPKLDSSGKGVNDESATSKKYSRDFLLTFSQHCTDLPEGFEITSEVASVITGASDREFPAPVKVVDRSGGPAKTDRRGNGMMDADKWNKQLGPFPPAQDPRIDLAHGNDALGFQGGRGPTFGVLRPRPQFLVQHGGGILSGPMHSSGFQGGQRNNSDADRWQRGSNFNKGLMPSPHIPAPVMHKAERKYEVGKITDEEQAKQRKLKGILNKLTPQNFERLFEQVKEVNIDNVTTLNGVISQIFDKALTELTFCEMYANFCQHLASELPDLIVDDEKITFRRLLLNKCQEEFERGEREEQEANNADGDDGTEQSEVVREEKRVKARKRMLGNIRLIGELYKKKMLTERIMHECIKKLLGQYHNPDEENIEALCKLMSTIGEMIDHPKAKEHMDAYFDIMGQLSNNTMLSSRVRFMLRDAIDLRKNKWQQRRKVEGPKKIEEVHRDAAQERQGQVSRLNRGASMNSGMRRGQPLDFSPRGSMLSSPIGPGMPYRGVPPQMRGFGGQDMRIDDRNVIDSHLLSVPLPQRSSSDHPITFGPQGGLGKSMTRGQPSMPVYGNSQSFGPPRRMAGSLSGHGIAPEREFYGTREDHFTRNASDRHGAAVAYDQSSSQELNSGYKNGESRYPDQNVDRSKPITASVPQNNSLEKLYPEDRLRDMSISAIKEFYSVKDEKEVALCIKDLNAPNFYPNVVSIWVTDSFERKDIERDLLAKLLVTLTKPRDGTFSTSQLIKGFESVLTNLEDTVTDAPKAPEFLGRIFAKVILENVLPLKDVGWLIQQGGEEPGRLREVGLSAEVLGSLLEMIKSEKGESSLKEIRASCNLQLEDFRPPQPIRCRKLEMFL